MARVRETEVDVDDVPEKYEPWPVDWTAVFVGALAAVGAAVIFGLIGTAVGAHQAAPDYRVTDLRTIGFLTLAFSVFGSFLAFVIGGWVTGRIAGVYRSEPAMLHGAVSFLVALPLLIVLAALGAGAYMGGWHGGLAGSAGGGAAGPYVQPVAPPVNASAVVHQEYERLWVAYHENVQRWQADTPAATRNAALGAVTALLLGLVGSVLGGWMACGEPMAITSHSTANEPRTTVDRTTV